MNNQLAIPVSIIIAGALIAGAMYFSNSTAPGGTKMVTSDELLAGESAPVPEVTEKDWIRGNPNAKLKIVEYSDPRCGFCARFHPTMQQIITDYAATGDVAWVYRHLPILGPDSHTQALALQCVGELGGQTKFWDNLDAHFVKNEELPLAQLGIAQADFDACINNADKKKMIDDMAFAASSLGIQGTPASFILFDGQQVSIDGAQPYDAVKKVIETLLKK